MANKKPDAAKPVAVEKSKFKAHLRTVSCSSAIIYRDNMPDIIDNKEAAVRWLAEKGFKAEEIEVMGEKPANWDTVFSPSVVLAEVLNEVLSPVETVAL